MTDSGFVQIIVLGALATLAAMVASAMMLARSDATHVAALERLVETDVAATSAFIRALTALTAPSDDFETRALTDKAVLPIGGISAAVRIEGESGKIDVLLSDPILLQRLAENAGVPTGDGQRLAMPAGCPSSSGVARALANTTTTCAASWCCASSPTRRRAARTYTSTTRLGT